MVSPRPSSFFQAGEFRWTQIILRLRAALADGLLFHMLFFNGRRPAACELAQLVQRLRQQGLQLVERFHTRFLCSRGLYLRCLNRCAIYYYDSIAVYHPGEVASHRRTPAAKRSSPEERTSLATSLPPSPSTGAERSRREPFPVCWSERGHYAPGQTNALPRGRWRPVSAVCRFPPRSLLNLRLCVSPSDCLSRVAPSGQLTPMQLGGHSLIFPRHLPGHQGPSWPARATRQT